MNIYYLFLLSLLIAGNSFATCALFGGRMPMSWWVFVFPVALSSVLGVIKFVEKEGVIIVGGIFVWLSTVIALAYLGGSYEVSI